MIAVFIHTADTKEQVKICKCWSLLPSFLYLHSPNSFLGTVVYDYSSTMNREMYVSFCKELVDRVILLLASNENHGITRVYVQTDSAGGHGGGRGSGMEKSLKEINDYAATVHCFNVYLSEFPV